jgi:hypothetical protein
VLIAKQERGRLPLEMGCKGTVAAAVRNELKGSRHGAPKSQGPGQGSGDGEPPAYAAAQRITSL